MCVPEADTTACQQVTLPLALAKPGGCQGLAGRVSCALAPSTEIALNNLFASLNPPNQGERFDTLLAHRNLHIERIVSTADIDSIEYVQEQDEWVLLLRGAAVMQVADETVTLGEGDYLFLPANTPHRVERCEAGTLWLAIHLHPDAYAPAG